MPTNITETARAARAALRKAFPGLKKTFSVTSRSSDITVTWTDAGPPIAQVQDALLAAGCAEAKKDWGGERRLVIPETSYGAYWFDRYNVAQRAAEQEERERRCQEQMAERQRVDEVIARESAARRSAWPTLWERKLPPVQDPSVLAAFETLRQRAEAEVQIGEDAERRPSWAPPLLLGEELGELCSKLGYIAEDDNGIARLWADFATPTRSGKWLREHASTLPLAGLHCRGFTLYAGAARGSRESLLFEAQREESGAWRFGPQEYALGYQSSRRREWEQLIQERERNRYELGHYGERLSPERQRQLDDGITEGWRKLAAIDVEDLIRATAHADRQRARQRALELARSRVLEFVGAPDAEMQTAARLWGHCAICGKALTDPLSLERGIGPDCYGHRINFIRQAASEGRALESIAAVAGMPIEFISTVLREEAVS